jgi:TPR repeat protein
LPYLNTATRLGRTLILLALGVAFVRPALADIADLGLSKALVKAVYIKALKGDPTSEVFIGDLYAKGQGVPKNPMEASRWYRLAAQKGSAQGAYWLAVAYDKGLGAPLSPKEAAKWLNSAVVKHYVPAEVMLGNYYAKGLGVSHNESRAAELYRAAADHGDPEAKAKLIIMITTGAMYGSGDGGLPIGEGLGWLNRTADHGDALAQEYLGLLNEQAQGTLHNPVSAYKWYSLSAAQGNGDAKKHLQSLEPKLNANQKAQGQAAAVAWWHQKRP